MDLSHIFENTAYVRTGGSPEERRCAEFILNECSKLGFSAYLEPFSVPMATIQEATLCIDGQAIPCKGYLCAGNGDITAPLYYLRDNTPYSLSQCKGKIVLFDGYLGYWRYQDLLKYGAVGFISYDGHVNYSDRDIDQRELRTYVSCGNLIPGVNINAKDATAIIAAGVQEASIHLVQVEYTADSHNVILDLPGELDEYIALTAHYDSTSLSEGAYDNMSSVAALLSIARQFSKTSHRYGLRFIWCGSEERGLLGSKAYCQSHAEELESIVLNVNLDMIGCIMGKFIAVCTTEDKLVPYIQYFSSEKGFSCTVRQDVYSSDSTPFADKGIPAVSFARIAPSNTATIHNRYDTKELMSMSQLAGDIAFISAFIDRIANAVMCPIARQIPDNMKEKLDEYLNRKRPKNT